MTLPGGVFVVPLDDGRKLLYAPYHQLRAVLNDSALQELRSGAPSTDELRSIAQILAERPDDVPQIACGPLGTPLFLGLVLTRGCNMNCVYCDFAGKKQQPKMSLELIRSGISAYLELLISKGIPSGDIHFFGGEPFHAWREMVFAVTYAQQQFRKAGVGLHLECTTNGLLSGSKAVWVGMNFDTVVLSWDGFAETQDRHRPLAGGAPSSEIVRRSAEIWAQSDCALIVRSCISGENVEQMRDWVLYLAQRFAPEAICLEPLIPSAESVKAGLETPVPDHFAESWKQAYAALEPYGIPLVFSSADLTQLRASLCPLGSDALLLDPNGTISACWQLDENRLHSGASLTLGRVEDGHFVIDQHGLDQIRSLCRDNRESCGACFCLPHCAGGCLLNRKLGLGEPFCQLTRELTRWQLLRSLEPEPLPQISDVVLPEETPLFHRDPFAGESWLAEKGLVRLLDLSGKDEDQLEERASVIRLQQTAGLSREEIQENMKWFEDEFSAPVDNCCG